MDLEISNAELNKKRKGIIEMCLYKYDKEKQREFDRQAGREEGREVGRMELLEELVGKN